MKGVLVFALLLLVPFAYADEGTGTVQTQCRVSDSCFSNETCWFKISNLSNGHAGSCSSSYTNSVCCTHTVEANLKTSCSAEEEDLLLFGEDGTLNAHLGDFYSPYNTHLCVETRVETTLECEITQDGQQTDGLDCVVSMSNLTNAHAATCDFTPYNYGLFCRGREAPYVNHTLQIKLKASSTTDTIYIPEIGATTYAQLQTTTYDADPPYLEASNGNKIHGVIGYLGTTSLATAKDASSYTLQLNQQQEPNKAALVFGKGDLELFLSNIGTLQANNYDSVAVANFGLKTDEEETSVKQGVLYEKITFRGTSTLSPGTYQMKFEHLGTRDKKILIKVSQVQ